MGKIIVAESEFHGGETLYKGKSLAQAVKAARKDTCAHWDTGCKCGGPEIKRVYKDGSHRIYYQWHAAKPGRYANEPFWFNTIKI